MFKGEVCCGGGFIFCVKVEVYLVKKEVVVENVCDVFFGDE